MRPGDEDKPVIPGRDGEYESLTTSPMAQFSRDKDRLWTHMPSIVQRRVS